VYNEKVWPDMYVLIGTRQTLEYTVPDLDFKEVVWKRPLSIPRHTWYPKKQRTSRKDE
jgi:hypothetical protein